MQIWAWLLFTGGSVMSILCGAKLPDMPGHWPDTVQFFMPAILCAASGLLLLYDSNKPLSGISRRQAAIYNELPADFTGNLVNLLTGLEAFQQRLEAADTSMQGLQSHLEHLYHCCLLPLAQQQASLACLNRRDGPQLQSHLARGERLFNRVWSHLNEICRQDALHACEQSHRAFTLLHKHLLN